MLVIVRDSGRKDAPTGRVTKIANVTATSVAATEARATSPKWLSERDSKELRA